MELWDKKGRRRHAETAYTIAGPTTFEGTTDAEGRLLHERVPSGDYTLTLTQTFPEELKLPPETHEVPLVVRRAASANPQVRRVGAIPHASLARLRGMVFDTNKTFLLPTALPALRKIRELYERHNPSRLLIVGHTDTSGEPNVNDPLSLERAKSVEQYLTDDVDAWLKNYEASVPQKKRWGAREDRLMMLKLSGYDARPPGKSAVLWYQERHNELVKSGSKPGRSELKADGLIGPKTRTELIYEYMAQDGVSLKDREDFVIDIQTHGAGENFPLAPAGQDLDERPASDRNDEKNQRDRRVELFFFDDEYGVVPAPSGPKGEEYLVWRRLAEDALDESVEGVTQKARVLQVPSAHFRTGSAVLLPEGETPTTGTGAALTSVGMLARALRFNEESTGHSLLVAGHTDSVGSDQSNDKLSAQRAELVHAVLTGNRDKFVEIASETGKVSDWKQIFRWTSAAVPGFEGTDPGVIDDNAATGKPSAEKFQRAYNANRQSLALGSEDLSPDGVVGKKTWGAVFDAYQWNLAEELGEVEEEANVDDPAERLAGLKKLQSLLKFLPTKKPFIGFGEHFPADGIGKNEVASEANRRVEVLFFEQGHEPDVTVLNEAPDVTELYGDEAFGRERLDMGPNAPARVVGVEGVFEYVVDEFPLLQMEKAFDIAMRKVFGDDLPKDAIAGLRRELADGSFPKPDFVLSDSLPDGVSGAYSSGLIHVARAAAEEANRSALGKWKLFTILLEEYGHFIDDHLRHRLAVGVADDSAGDEGTHFGAFYICFHQLFTEDLDAGALLLRRGAKKRAFERRIAISRDQLGEDERAKFFLWAQEEGSDAGYVTIEGVTYQAEYFKIEGQGAVHERITAEAAKAAGVKFDDRLDIGVAWPDVPTWDENSPAVPFPPSGMNKDQQIYNSPRAAYAAFLRMETAHRMGRANKNDPAFKSHYGQNQFWHAMSPGSHLTNGQIVDKILRQHQIWWDWALADRFATVGIPLPLGILPQGLFHVGKILHTVQDSFSESHTIRNSAGEIESFQDYTKQDAEKHGEADKDRSSKALHDIPGAVQAIKHSTEVLRLFKEKRPFVELEEYLLKNVFVLAPGASDKPSGKVPQEFEIDE